MSRDKRINRNCGGYGELSIHDPGHGHIAQNTTLPMNRFCFAEIDCPSRSQSEDTTASARPHFPYVNKAVPLKSVLPSSSSQSAAAVDLQRRLNQTRRS